MPRSTRAVRRRSSPLATTPPTRWWRGPPPAWPRPLDRLLDAWWRVPLRLRLVLVALIIGLAIAGLVHRTTRSPWGRAVPVLVAAADAAPGDDLMATSADWPDDLVPARALTALPGEAIATRPVRAGDVLTELDVARDLADLVRPGEVAIALAQDLPDLPAGARLVVLGTGFDGTGRHLASGRLLARSSEWTWVAVAASAAPSVAAAMATGQVTVALAGPG